MRFRKKDLIRGCLVLIVVLIVVGVLFPDFIQWLIGLIGGGVALGVAGMFLGG